MKMKKMRILKKCISVCAMSAFLICGLTACQQVGDFIQFTMSGEKVTAINVGMSRQGMM